MATTYSANVSLSCFATTTFPAGATNNVLTSYSVPITISPAQAYSTGTAANLVQKVAQVSVTSASTSTFDLSLTSTGAGAVQCTDGTYGFAHVREWIIINDSATDTQFLKIDFTVANSFGPHATPGSGFIEGTMTTVKMDLQPGGNWLRFAKPIGTNGVTVDSTHKIITIDPIGASVAFRMVLIGD